ncbi:MAG: hypothetical protein KDJ88_08125 [Bauldia sp.]|nr:hypothetical protein [Bauldia sp.]
MKLLRLVAGLVIAAGLMAPLSPAYAQDQAAAQYAGQWHCQYSMQPFNKDPLSTHYWEFDIALQPDAGYKMQGFYYSPSLGFQIPVYGEGQWGMTNQGPSGTAIAVKGQIYRQDAGWIPFDMIVTPNDPRTLYLQFKGATHFTNIVCQR